MGWFITTRRIYSCRPRNSSQRPCFAMRIRRCASCFSGTDPVYPSPGHTGAVCCCSFQYYMRVHLPRSSMPTPIAMGENEALSAVPSKTLTRSKCRLENADVLIICSKSKSCLIGARGQWTSISVSRFPRARVCLRPRDAALDNRI